MQADGERLLLPPSFALITLPLLSTHWPSTPIDLETGSAWQLLSLLGLLQGEASDVVCTGRDSGAAVGLSKCPRLDVWGH